MTEPPVLSVIVPAAGRPQYLAELLESLRKQEFDGLFEVVVVNDRPAIDLSHLGFETGLCKCRVVEGAGKGPARARNLGVRHARGTFILFLDDDSVIDPQFLQRVLRELEGFPGHAISGLQMAVERENVFALTAEWLHHSFLEGEALEPPLAKFAATNPLALERADFLDCAGFDPSFSLAAGEDREFCVRWLAAGFHIRIVDEASIGHRFPHSLSALMKQQWRYGRGAFHFDTRVSTGEKLHVRRASYYWRLLARSPRRYGFRRGLVVGLLAWFSQAVIACGYLCERRRWLGEVPSEFAEVGASRLMAASPKPLVSVLIEGYNDSLDLGSALETVRALAEQTYPLDRVELVLTGSEEQAARWQAALAGERRFFAIKVIGVEAHYYRLKNLAAEAAAGEILVFTDSDTLAEPGWLAAIVRGIQSGAFIVAGLTGYRWEDGSSSWPGVLAAAASISWGFIVPNPGEPARGFLSHNVAFRRSVLEKMPYREDLGRTCAGSFLHDEILRRGLAIAFRADQRVRHVFSFGWWLKRLHVRFGYEVFLLRRLNPASRYGWTQKLWVLEPAATAAWHVALDAPQWMRYSGQLGWSRPRRIVYLPLVLLLSLAARSAEAYGMYSTMLNPERMRRFALSN